MGFDITSFLNTELSDFDIQAMNENLVNLRKQMGTILSRAKEEAKGDTCLYCRKPVTSMCNSHNIPQFCLKNIDENGKLKYFNEFVGMPLLDADKGVKSAGTFHIICKACDSTIFQEYENPDNYEIEPFEVSDLMLAEIALKDYMKAIYKRKLEIGMYKIMAETTPFPFGQMLAHEKNSVIDLDLKEYTNSFNKAKRIIEAINSGNTIDEGYDVIYCRKLDYVAPIALQSCFVLASDFNGNEVNEPYNNSPDYHPRDIHLEVLPLENSTLILLFVDSKEHVYDEFKRQFQSLSEDDKLGAISYIIFLYTEDYFLSPEASTDILESEKLKDVFSVTSDAVVSGFGLNEKEAREQAMRVNCERMRLDKWNEVPCVFDKKYRI